jgi:hypothetical protein
VVKRSKIRDSPFSDESIGLKFKLFGKNEDLEAL